jgi:hypothetical protein
MGIFSGLKTAATQQVAWNNDPVQQEITALLLSASQDQQYASVIEQILIIFNQQGWTKEEALNRLSHAVSMVWRFADRGSYKVAKAITNDIAKVARNVSPEVLGGYRPLSPQTKRPDEQQGRTMKAVSEEDAERIGQQIMDLFETNSLTVGQSVQVLTITTMVALKNMPPGVKEEMKKKIIDAVRACS